MDAETKLYRKRIDWYCKSCGEKIYPKLKVRVGNNANRPCEEVPLFHSIQLRNLVETYLKVDINYRSVEQRDLDELRENRNLFWNLIYYFSATNIPLEFIVPYKDSALLKQLPEMLEIQSKQLLVENTRRYGLSYLDSYIALTDRGRGFTSESLRHLISSKNAAAVPPAFDLIPFSHQDSRLSIQRMSGVSNNLRKSNPTSGENSSRNRATEISKGRNAKPERSKRKANN